MNLLFLVLRIVAPERVDAEGGRCSNGRRVLALHIKLLSQRRHRCSNDLFGKVLVIDLGDVVEAESALAERRVGVFAAQLDVEHLLSAELGPNRMFIGLQLQFVFLELLIVFGIRKFVEVTSVDRGRLLVLGHLNRIEALFAGGDVDVASHEIEEVCALNEDLGHPCVVVFLLGNVAIGALLCFLGAHCVRDIGTEGLSAEAFG